MYFGEIWRAQWPFMPHRTTIQTLHIGDSQLSWIL